MSTEEDINVRYHAYTTNSRSDAVEKFPELEEAYRLKDASAAFAERAFPTDAHTRERFAKITEDHIKKELARGAELPVIRHTQQDHDAKQERTQDNER